MLSARPLSRPALGSAFGAALRLAAAAIVLGLALPLALPPALGAPERPSVRVTDRAGRLLREVRPSGSARPVRLADVTPFTVRALVATEDRRFYQHAGIDGRAIGRALRQNAAAGRTVSGGSTLTMQLARLLRSPAETAPRGLRQKMAEAHLAVRLELWRSKDDLLEAWLARAPFGRQTRGLAAASHLYFGKAPAALTDAEAALLVGLPQSPSRLDPYRYPARARARQRRVLEAMAETGALSPESARRLAALPLDLRPPAGRFLAPHFVEHVLASGAIKQATGADHERHGSDDARPAASAHGRAPRAAPRRRARARARGPGGGGGAGKCDGRRARLRRQRRLFRPGGARPDRRRAGAPAARQHAQAIHLRRRHRAPRLPRRDAPARPAGRRPGGRRRLCAGQLRRPLSRRRAAAPRARVVVQRARRGRGRARGAGRVARVLPRRRPALADAPGTLLRRRDDARRRRSDAAGVGPELRRPRPLRRRPTV